MVSLSFQSSNAQCFCRSYAQIFFLCKKGCRVGNFAIVLSHFFVRVEMESRGGCLLRIMLQLTLMFWLSVIGIMLVVGES